MPSVNGLDPARRFAVPLRLLTSGGHMAMPGCLNPRTADTEPLLKASVDFKARDRDGDTPPMWASASNQNPDVITTILKAGTERRGESRRRRRPLTTRMATRSRKAPMFTGSSTTRSIKRGGDAAWGGKKIPKASRKLHHGPFRCKVFDAGARRGRRRPWRRSSTRCIMSQSVCRCSLNSR